MKMAVQLILEMELFIKLPWPPSLNSVYRRRGRGPGMFLSPEGKAWFTEAISLLQDHPSYRLHRWGWWSRLRLSFALVPPTARAYDIDNRDKLILDALEKSGLIFNDSQIYRGPRWKFDKQPKGRYAGVYLGLNEVSVNTGEVFHGEQWEEAKDETD